MNAVLNSSCNADRQRRSPRQAERPAAANAAAASFAALTDNLDYLDPASIEQVRQAYRFADEAHLGQLRNSGEPYITHPIAVAALCADLEARRPGIDGRPAARRHGRLRRHQGRVDRTLSAHPVAELVDGLTKLDKLQFNTREENQAESFRKMLLAMARDVRVILIKLADRTHNMRTLADMPRSKWGRISSETLEIYAPIAHRLGLNQTYRELQDLVPVSASLASPGSEQGGQQGAQPPARSGAEGASARWRLLLTHGMKVRIAGREKTLYAIYQKMDLKHLSFAQVTDIYGFRVIVPTITDCYTALGVLHQMYKPVPGKFKDHIAIPNSTATSRCTPRW
jgi:guanosine-3',5'-bis(diphosphate) 3'-pyrophosphohydrolase